MTTTLRDFPFEDDRCAPPESGLAYAVDGLEEPAEVTICPWDADEASLVTTWLSTDAEAAVALDEMR